MSCGRRSAAQECEQRSVHLVGVGPWDGVRAALDHLQLEVVDQAGQTLAGLVKRQDLVGVTLYHEYWYIDLGQVGGKSVVHVGMQATAAVAEAVAAMFQLAW